MKSRYDNQALVDGMNKDVQEQLKNSTVAIVGVGGLGCPLSLNLAEMGIGKLLLIDDDAVALSNLNRQHLFTPDDLGKSKAEVAAAYLRKFNPEIEIVTIQERLNARNMEKLLSTAMVVADCTDNLVVRYRLDEYCGQNEKPLIFAGVRKWQGQFGLFHYQKKTALSDLFPPDPSVFQTEDCESLGTFGFVCSHMASLQAAEIFKLISGLGEVQEGILQLADLEFLEFRKHRIPENS